MALAFTSGDTVAISPAASINSLQKSTRLMLIWFNNFVANTGYCGKGSGVTRKQLLNPGNTAVFQSEVRTTAGIYSTAADHANFATSFTTGKWLWIADTYDLDVNASGKLYCGDLSNQVAEPSAYTTQVGTAGTAGDDSAGNLLIGVDGDGDATLDGNVALYAQWNRVLSLSELRQQQVYDPVVTSGLAVFMHLEPIDDGSPTGTQTDLSGNGNNGTATGTTFFAHPNLSHIRTPSAVALALAGIAPARVLSNVITPFTP